MAHRTFKDRIGMTWEVWDVRPAAHAVMASSFADGWLCFQSGASRKRLTPIPDSWETLPEEELTRLWRQATPVSPRS